MEVALDISLRNPNHRRSFSSEDDTESIYSVQARETDVVQDSQSENYDDFSSTSTFELEYEVATSDSDDGAAQYEVLLGTGADGVSSSGEDDMNVTAAIAAVLCDTSLEAWATDGEDSDTTAYNDSISSAASAGGRVADFSTCLQCNGRNDQPKVQYCDKCFQRCWQCKTRKNYNCFPLCNDCYKVRKNLFPPRPRGARKRKMERQAAEETQAQEKRKHLSNDDSAVKLTTLQHCLSGLSQDSGLGSSQEIPVLNFDQIVMPKHHQQQDLKRKRCSSIESDISDTLPTSCKVSKLEPLSNDVTDVKNLPSTSNAVNIVNSAIINDTNRTTSDQINVVKTTTTILSGRTNSVANFNENFADSKSINLTTSVKIPSDDDKSKNLSETNLAVASSSKITSYLEPKKSTSLEELSTISEQTDSSDFKRDVATSDNSSAYTKYKEKIHSNSDLGSIAHATGMGPLPELKELCIICNISPKNGIFLHGKIAHMCCCYKCAMKTWRISKRCPICNCKVKNVVKVFTT